MPAEFEPPCFIKEGYQVPDTLQHCFAIKKEAQAVEAIDKSGPVQAIQICKQPVDSTDCRNAQATKQCPFLKSQSRLPA